MRRHRIILLIASIFVTTFLAIYFGEMIHRRDFDRAFFAWYQNQTPENEANLRKEQRKSEMIRITDSTVAAVIVTVFAFGCYTAVKYVRKRGIRSVSTRR